MHQALNLGAHIPKSVRSTQSSVVLTPFSSLSSHSPLLWPSTRNHHRAKKRHTNGLKNQTAQRQSAEESLRGPPLPVLPRRKTEQKQREKKAI